MTTVAAPCLVCNGRGQVAAGTGCPVCRGTGMSTAEDAASYREVLVAGAVEGARQQFWRAGEMAAEATLRAVGQARTDARMAAADAQTAAAQAREHVRMLRAAMNAAAAAAPEMAGQLRAFAPPDPTDPPPGITLPAGMGGEIMYYDSLLVRQMDVWGNLNAPSIPGATWANVITFGADPTGVADSTNAILAAFNSLPLAGSPGKGGTVYFPGGSVYKTTATIGSSAVAPVYLLGDGPQSTTIMFYGAGDAVSLTQNYKPAGGSASIKVWGSGVRGMTIDGTNHAAGQSSGLHTGDMKYGHVERVQIQHFNQAGDIGLWIDNRNFWTEDSFFEVHSQDCTTLFQIDATGSLGVGTAATAHDNCQYYFSCAALPNQDALHITNGANLYHSRLWLHGGMKSNASAVTSAALRIDDQTSAVHSSANRCEIVIQMESDGGQAFTPQTIVLNAAGNTIASAWGRIAFINTYSAATLNGQFQFNGPVSGDATLSGHIPSGVPANGAPVTNSACAAVMSVTGGTVSNIKIAGVATGLTSGAFYVAPNQTYEIDYSVAPTVTWSSAVPG